VSGGSPAARQPLQTIVTTDPEDLADKAVALVMETLRAAIAARGEARIVLSGGSTPRETHRGVAEAILRERIDVGRITWYFGDERWVPVDHPDSNEGMARATLLGPIGAPEASIQSWRPAVGEPRESAADYGARIRAGGGERLFDLVLLGMGADGHTASLFPGASATLPDGRRLPVARDLPADTAAVEKGGGWRLTLCPVLLNHCRTVAFLVSGADKAPALARARAGAPDTPAAWIRGGSTYFIVTRDAMPAEGI
jgi:6-phosphogluconolactonase